MSRGLCWIMGLLPYGNMMSWPHFPLPQTASPIVLAGVATHCSAYLYMCGPFAFGYVYRVQHARGERSLWFFHPLTMLR
jgi:hypothetical protein